MSTKKISFVEIILWLFVVLLVLVAATPFAIGFKVKSEYANVVNNISEMSQLDIQVIQYEQGIFSSTSTLAISLPGISEQVQFKEEIIHGPFYFGLINQGKSPFAAAVIKGQLDISATQQALSDKMFAGEKPLVYQGIVGFSGDIDIGVYVPPINTTYEDESGVVTIKSAGIIIAESYSMSTSVFSGDIRMPLINMESDLYSATAESINVSFSGSMGENQLIIGDSVASLGLVNIDMPGNQFTLRELNISSVTSENANLMSSGIQLSAREIFASNQKFGPVNFNMSVNGLNAQSLLQIQEIQNTLEEKINQGIPPEQVNAMMMGQIMGVLPDLIKEAEIKINPLSINSELGKLEADLEFKLEGIDSNAPADPMFLLNAISLDMNLSIDDSLLKQFISWQLEGRQQAMLYQGSLESQKAELEIPLEQQVSENIQGLIDINWLVKSEGVYLSNIAMHEGALLINDKPADPMQQLMGAVGSAAPAPAAVPQ